MIEFTWKIESVDDLSRTMIVLYSTENKSQRVSIPQPPEGQDVNQWINQFAPINYFLQEPVTPVIVGQTGSGSVESVTPAPSVPVLTSLEFINKFTEEEKLAITTASLTDPVIRLWYDQIIAARSVSMGDLRVTSGVTHLVTAGVITQARADEILAS